MRNEVNIGLFALIMMFICWLVWQLLPKPDYILPVEKSRVEAVIADYYKEHPIKQNQQPDIKIQRINTEIREINLSDIKVIDQIAIYIKKKEGFRGKAYKDHHQYSIGYGTRASSPNEVITQKEANIRLYKHIRRVIVPSFKNVYFQSIEQVYAAIDFSYNLGHNRFVREIVDESGYIDCAKMMAYNKVRDRHGNLVYNEGLAQRRLENFLACASYEIIGESDE